MCLSRVTLAENERERVFPSTLILLSPPILRVGLAAGLQGNKGPFSPGGRVSRV